MLMLSAKQYSHVHELHHMLDNIQCTIHQGRYNFILISTCVAMCNFVPQRMLYHQPHLLWQPTWFYVLPFDLHLMYTCTCTFSLTNFLTNVIEAYSRMLTSYKPHTLPLIPMSSYPAIPKLCPYSTIALV